MRALPRIAALLSAALLSGCWVGPDFYGDVAPAQPIAPGRYAIVDTDAMLLEDEQALWMSERLGQRVIIDYDRDGYAVVETRLDQADGPQRAKIVPIDAAEGLYAAAVDPGEGQIELGTRVYALLMMVPDGYRIAIPPCDGTRRLGRSPVIVRGVLFGLQCRFEKREDFERAMREYARDPVSWTEYRREA